jgi:hypothetical protein
VNSTETIFRLDPEALLDCRKSELIWGGFDEQGKREAGRLSIQDPNAANRDTGDSCWRAVFPASVACFPA